MYHGGPLAHRVPRLAVRDAARRLGRALTGVAVILLMTQPAAAQDKAAPANGATNQSLTPTLSWSADGLAFGYDYCWDTSNDGACENWISAGTATSATLPVLSYQTTYYWQVRSKRAVIFPVPHTVYEYGDGGVYWSFSTRALFRKTAPSNGAWGQTLAPTLSWEAYPYTMTRYEYCYDTVDDGACGGTWTSAGTATSVSLSSLSYGTRYYWQVRAVRVILTRTYYYDADDGTWATFSTVFAKTSPASGAYNQTLAPTLSWGTAVGDSGLGYYSYCVDTTNDGACDGAWTSTEYATSVTLPTLSYGTTYYWQVRAAHLVVIGGMPRFVYEYANADSWWSFSTTFPKTSPTNGATLTTLSPTLSWGTAALNPLRYEYCYDTLNDGACTGTWTSTGTATSVALSGLTEGTTYYWQVRSVRQILPTLFRYDYADAGSYWSFKTAKPLPFKKVSPANGAVSQPLRPTLTWGASSGAASYQICAYPRGGSCISWLSVGRVTSYTVPSSLAERTTFYWQVRAVNAAGTTEADGGTYWTFTTLGTRIIRLAYVPLEFGYVAAGSTGTRTMRIYNDGDSTLTVSGITYPTGFTGAWSGTIAAGSYRDVIVTFAPTAAIAYAGPVTVASNATSGTGTTSASGTAVATRIIALSGSLAFGSVAVGSTATRTLTISNSGNSPLTVSGITYPGGFTGAWSGTIAPGGSQPVTVTFAPTAATSYGGTVTVLSNKTSGTSTTTASGTGTPVPTRIIALSGSLAFGSVTVGSTAARTLTISNSGNSPLTVSGITYPGGFTGAWSGVIAPGASHPVTVTFAPTAETSYGGTVTVLSDKTSGTNTTTASGTGAPAATRIISLTGSLAFGSVPVGTTATATLTIRNTGTEVLTVSGITYPEGFSGAWGGTISAPGHKDVTVTFAPTAAIDYGGTVTVLSDKTSGTNTTTASGTGTGAAPPPGDFTGDGTSDILWRHTTGGDLWLWPMADATKAGEFYVRTLADLNWEIRGLGDQNGDGKADVLWRNKANGQIYVWPMNGATPVAETYVATVATAYDIVGTGDFNGDGKSDILWRNPTVGDVWVWLMDGATTLASTYVDTVDPGYGVKGVGDLDGNSKADIVWQGAAGDVWVWLMDGTTRLSQTYVGAVSDTTYQLQQVADFDGNGKADLLWWNSVQGDVWIWAMNGAVKEAETYVGIVPDTRYRIQAAGDFDGDGMSDILWRNVVAGGDVWVWVMNNGFTKLGEYYVGTVPDTGYQIVVK